MDTKVCILNYGSGNVQSVFNMLSTLTGSVLISNKPSDIQSATHLILPGVGAFGVAMEKIRKNIPLEILKSEVLEKKKPFLGICVGMQVLADQGFEFGAHEGLGWIPGTVRVLDSKEAPLPHIGWNNIEKKNHSDLLKHFSDSQDFYFVHSYAFAPKEPAHILAETSYGENFCSVIGKDNIFGVQFHPEKSQKAGKLLVKSFLELS